MYLLLYIVGISFSAFVTTSFICALLSPKLKRIATPTHNAQQREEYFKALFYSRRILSQKRKAAAKVVVVLENDVQFHFWAAPSLSQKSFCRRLCRLPPGAFISSRR